jgi:hypothetical protein
MKEVIPLLAINASTNDGKTWARSVYARSLCIGKQYIHGFTIWRTPIADVVALSQDSLIRIRNISKKCILEISDKLNALGIQTGWRIE